MKYQLKEQLAKDAIEAVLKDKSKFIVSPNDVPKKWLEKKASFVTLKEDGILRGCIGDVEPFEPLYQNIIRNAVNAAFNDPRFLPVSIEELERLEIEVSVLSQPKPFNPKNVEDLLNYLDKNRPGLIIEKGYNRALFLPQVWEELKDPIDFLSHLCLKAGLSPLEWKNIGGVKFRIFTCEK